jgi:hypothetical protein
MCPASPHVPCRGLSALHAQAGSPRLPASAGRAPPGSPVGPRHPNAVDLYLLGRGNVDSIDGGLVTEGERWLAHSC